MKSWKFQENKKAKEIRLFYIKYRMRENRERSLEEMGCLKILIQTSVSPMMILVERIKKYADFLA